MTVNTKRKLFHILNERARREQREREQREEDLYKMWSNDPRRKDNMQWIEPLIEDE
jgi:hypothetical protein